MRNFLSLRLLSTFSKKALPAIAGFLIASLVVTSCTEDVDEISTSQISEKQTPSLTLAPTSGEWIHIEGQSENNARRATQAPGVDRGRFNITLKYAFQDIFPVNERQKEVFEQAAARWERIIIKDKPSFTGALPSAFDEEPFFDDFPPLVDGTVDDIIIEVVLAPIDGPGRILGQAGPRFVRTSDFLTLSGVMFFDVADLGFLDQLDLFEEVIVHEMGHVLGVGTLWNVAPSFDRTLREGSDFNPFFAGKQANVFWNAEGGEGKLPIEGIQERVGTRFSHWDEDVLDNELMTGFLNLGENPLSRITAGSVRDLGYGAAMVGENYDLPRGTQGVTVEDDPHAAAHWEGLHIAEMEELLYPIGSVTVK